MLKRYWHGLPWTGEGWGPGDDPVLADLRQWAAGQWLHSQPPLLRHGLRLADRLLWPVAAFARSRAFARAREDTAAASLFRDSLMSGATPMEAQAWRSLHGTRHPLPARASALLMSRLGEQTAQRLLADKLAAATVLGRVGIPFPTLHGICRKGEIPRLPTGTAGRGDLFIKPRHGQGGRGGFCLTRSGDSWQMDGAAVAESALLDRMNRAAAQDDLLIQERLVAPPDLADLATCDRAPVLRIVTARHPEAAPFLHSALVSIGVPGRSPAHFLEGAVYAAIDPSTGRLVDGLSLGQPGTRMATLPWNGALLAGRPLAGFEEAVAIALRAMAALPPTPVLHWDVIPTATGAVMLEGNTSGNWIIASLPGLHGLEACPLPPLLMLWRAAADEWIERNEPRLT